jgi:hypothetical protein
MFKVAGFHPYDNEHVCQIFERNHSLYLQTQNIKSGELTYPLSIIKQSIRCPWMHELCFRGNDNFSYVILRDSCNKNLTKVIKGLFEIFQFEMNYRNMRYDIQKSFLYIMQDNAILKCSHNSFIKYLYTNDLDCSNKQVVTIKWQDFVVTNGNIFFMENGTIFTEDRLPIMTSNYGSIPFSIFPKDQEVGNPFPWHLVMYLLEFVIIIILVYLCRIQIHRSASGRIQFHPIVGPYAQA